MQATTGKLESFPWPLQDRREEDYVDAKKAMEERKLQIREPNSNVWKDYPYTGGVGFIYPADCYRRKPE